MLFTQSQKDNCKQDTSEAEQIGYGQGNTEPEHRKQRGADRLNGGNQTDDRWSDVAYAFDVQGKGEHRTKNNHAADKEDGFSIQHDRGSSGLLPKHDRNAADEHTPADHSKRVVIGQKGDRGHGIDGDKDRAKQSPEKGLAGERQRMKAAMRGN